MNKTQDIEKDVEKLYDHARVANGEMSVIKVDLATVKNDVSWLKRFFWIVATSSVGSFLGAVWQLLTR